jgi:hypothetical protein
LPRVWSACRCASDPVLAALAVRAELAAGPITAHDAAFRLTPRLNAAGRLGEAQLALDLLLAGDADAERLAAELDDQNTERQRVQELVWKEALAQASAQVAELDAPALVVGAEGWHAGVVGIIAARLVDPVRASRDRDRVSRRRGEGVGAYGGRRQPVRRAGALRVSPDEVRRPRRRGRMSNRHRRAGWLPSGLRRRGGAPAGGGGGGRRRWRSTRR